MKKQVQKSKLNFELSKFNYYFSKKKNLLIFLLLFLGTLLPTLSGSENFNFWNKLYNILNNPIYNMLFFTAIGLNVIYLISEFFKSYSMINRYSNFKRMLKMFAKDIVIYTIYLAIVSLIIAIAGSVLFSLGDFSMINHPIYNIPIVFYIVFYFVRSVIITCIINLIIYILFILLEKIMTTILILLNGILFFNLPSDLSPINHFYNMKLIYHNYFTVVYYNSFLLEITCSFLEIFFLLLIYKILYFHFISKKRDLI